MKCGECGGEIFKAYGGGVVAWIFVLCNPSSN